mgnify:FL=1
MILAVLLIMRKKKRQKPELVTPPDVQPVPPIPPDSGPKTEWLAPTPPDSKSKIESLTPTQPVDSKLKPGKKQFFLYSKTQ